MDHKTALLILASATAGTAWAQSTSSEKPITTSVVEISEARLPASTAARSDYRFEGDPSVSIDTTELSSKVANFFVGSSGARSFTDTISLRGLANTPLFGDPAVTVYLDDMPLGGGFTFPSGLVGFTSAELFRGPGQNTRFGRAGTVGVLRFETPAPAPAGNDEIRAYFGNFNARGVSARGETHSSDDVGVYAAVGYEARDGYITNTRLHTDIDGRESTSALARLKFRAGTDGDWTLLVTGQRARDGVQPLVPLSGPKFEVDRSEEGITHVDDGGVSLRGSFDTSIGVLSETTSFSFWRLGPATNALDFGFAELEDSSRLKQNVWSEEISLASAKRDNWEGTLGIFAAHDRTDGGFTRAFSGRVFEESTYRIRHDGLAAFGEMNLRLTPELSLTPGARVEENWKQMDRSEIVPGSSVFNRKADSAAILPKLMANYQINAATEASFGFSTGYKPGGFSSFTGNRSLARFDAERVAGLDAALSTGHRGMWTATVRGFAYRIHDYQIERSFKTGAVADDYIVVNAPRARSVGAELELAATPVRGLSVGLNFGLTDITLQEFKDPYTGISYDGKRAPYAPFYTGQAFVEYHESHGWFGRIQTVVTGRTYYTESESATFSQSAYALLDARFGYARGVYRISLYGENLTDREYFSAITPGTFHGTPGAPRTYGVEGELRF